MPLFLLEICRIELQCHTMRGIISSEQENNVTYKEVIDMAYSDRIKRLKEEFEGKQVNYEGKTYKIAKVDYNGIIHIDKPAKFTDTTAVYTEVEARMNLV